ncbi:copper chaperone PCu(A)C [Neptuniibacter halophilus]|uniref:copper chaperone PCu(A)C n=1 Tax=Neptuniibacter halophilus TaxID=651666 RepID=UPI002572BA8F|nr:copper chaperone PCu(A)C [Neptuniibacter halophilus]
MTKARLRTTLIAACLGFSATAMAEISIEGAYARAVPPGQKISASFMQLNNSDAEKVALVSASSAVAESVELHTHSHADGVMQMRQVEQIEVPASGSVTLQPGGYHIMLIGLKQDLPEGSHIDLQLNFSDGTRQDLNLPVKRVMAGMQHGKMNH